MVCRQSKNFACYLFFLVGFQLLHVHNMMIQQETVTDSVFVNQNVLAFELIPGYLSKHERVQFHAGQLTFPLRLLLFEQ